MADLTFALAGKNVVDAGTATGSPKDTAEIVYSGNIAAAKNVSVTLLEIDPGETQKPDKPQKAKALATFKGEIVAAATPAKGQPPGDFKLGTGPSDTPTQKLDPDAIFFQLKIGGQTFKIPLRSLTEEAGRRFEVQIQASGTAGKKKVKFTSKALLFARFGHFKKDPRAPVIAFITGGDDGAFFEASAFFWRQHADVVVQKDGMSLQEIVQSLAARSKRVLEETGGKGWGEVNIVCHGNPISASIRILPSSKDRNLRITQLNKVLAANPSAFAAGDLGLSSSSRVVFRSCNVGKRADLLQRVAKDVFGGICEVKAPKFLQVYAVQDVTKSGGPATESFVEEIRKHLRVDTKPSDAAAEAAMAAKFKEMQDKNAPGKQQSFGIEKATFTLKKIEPATNSLGISLAHEAFLTVNANDHSPITDPTALFVEALDKQQTTDNFDFSGSKRWKFGKHEVTSRKAVAELEVRASAPDTRPPRGVGNSFITIGSSDAVKAELIKLRGNAAVNALHSPAAALGDGTIEVNLTSKTGFRVIGKGATFNANGKNGITSLTGNVQGDATVTVDAGTETLTIGRSHSVQVNVPINRFLVSFRRELRENDPKKAFAKRAVIVPDIDNTAHYGSSKDAAPTDAELASLGD